MKPTLILLAIDKSAASTAALRVAARLAIALKAQVRVLQVDHESVSDVAADTSAAEALRTLTKLGVAARIEVRGGDPVDEILAATRSLKCDLLVMGSRGRSRLAGMLLGSITREVVARVTCPVLLVRADSQTIKAPCSILMAIEGLEGSGPLVEVTGSLARVLDAKVTVAHVSFPGGEDLERALYHARNTHGEQALSAAVAELTKRGVQVESKSLTATVGIPRAIASYAERIDADLIVMGAHPPAGPTGYAGIEESMSVSHLSERPLLVTSEQQGELDEGDLHEHSS